MTNIAICYTLLALVSALIANLLAPYPRKVHYVSLMMASIILISFAPSYLMNGRKGFILVALPISLVVISVFRILNSYREPLTALYAEPKQVRNSNDLAYISCIISLAAIALRIVVISPQLNHLLYK